MFAIPYLSPGDSDDENASLHNTHRNHIVDIFRQDIGWPISSSLPTSLPLVYLCKHDKVFEIACKNSPDGSLHKSGKAKQAIASSKPFYFYDRRYIRPYDGKNPIVLSIHMISLFIDMKRRTIIIRNQIDNLL